MAAPAVRTAFQQYLAATGLDRRVEVTSSGDGVVEVLAAGVNKGAALRALANHLRIALEHTVALGDEGNDIPALRAAGLGIAMGNAPDPVKRAAGVVAGTNTAGGWAEAVNRYVLGEGSARDPS